MTDDISAAPTAADEKVAELTAIVARLTAENADLRKQLAAKSGMGIQANEPETFRNLKEGKQP